MHVLLLGSGGREHALAWKIGQSPLVETLSVAPGRLGVNGNPVDLDINNGVAVAAWAKQNRVDLVVVGPEAPLAAGVVNILDAAGIPVFGPTQAAARLETSKRFTKELCDRAGIPTAAWRAFTDAETAYSYAVGFDVPPVIKQDGLAGGKGVVVPGSWLETEEAIHAALQAGSEVIVEELLEGTEASVFVLADGRRFHACGTAQDYKRAYDGNTGPNTGGMGAISPAPGLSADMQREVHERIIQPALDEMVARGTPFRGVLYAGIMITKNGPKLIEFNVRFGDPECQVLMRRLSSDIVPVLYDMARGADEPHLMSWRDEVAITVVLAAHGYPGQYQTVPVDLEAIINAQQPGITVFHAGTQWNYKHNHFDVVGGRVLNITATGATIEEARNRVYEAVSGLKWTGGFHRSDIGLT